MKLLESPMEEDPGLPHQYFDIVFSIYALGWTTNLEKTLDNINKYLKSGGTFIFSWEHPLYNRIKNNDGDLRLIKSYHEEGSYDHEAWSSPAMMQQFKLSTYINSLISHGFMIEKMIEDVCISDDIIPKHVNGWYSYEKAKMIPTTLIIKSRKFNITQRKCKYCPINKIHQKILPMHIYVQIVGIVSVCAVLRYHLRQQQILL